MAIVSPNEGDRVEIFVRGSWQEARVTEVYVAPPGFIAVWSGGSEHIFVKDATRWRWPVVKGAG